MTTVCSPKSTEPREQIRRQMEAMLASGLADINVAEMLGLATSILSEVERSNYLHQHPDDKGNGSYSRKVQVGSVPLPLDVPRTRSGEFRPSLLPPPYQRGFTETQRELLLGLLYSGRSINAVKASLKNLGLSHREEDLDFLAREFIDEYQLRNSRPLDPDWLALYIDGKHVEIRDGERIRACCIYVIIGIAYDGKKHVLACFLGSTRESLEDWKKALRSIVERGVRRVLLVVQDDFSGLLSLTKGLFPNSDIQLCIVHMQRNAKSHFNKATNAAFQRRMREIKACADPERAAAMFDAMCDQFKEESPSFVAELRKKRAHYLTFLTYPDSIRATCSTTNAVEAVNGQLERMRINSGGYFHSEENLKLKLALAVRFLEDGKWRKPAASIRSALHDLHLMFTARFERDE